MRHFLDLTDWTPDEIDSLLTLATDLKREWQHGGNHQQLKGKVLAMVFQKPSLRTRVSFDVAMLHLGGHALYLSPAEIGLGQRESVGDVARVLSGYTQGIMARVYEHNHLLELASASRVPVINGLSDRSHPCQVLADLLTIRDHFGKLPGLRIAFVGDTNNVARSLATGVARTGMALAIASPDGYAPDTEFLQEADESELRLTVTKNPVEAVHNADVIYTDTWVSMGQEAETDKRLVALRNYQVNSALLAAAPKHAIVLHCLPAHRGVEITDDVMDGPQSAVFAQAENRLHAQKAILVRLMAE